MNSEFHSEPDSRNAPKLICVAEDDLVIHISDLGAAESPFWDASTCTIWLVDMTAPALIQYDPSADVTLRWPMPETIGSFALCEADNLVLVALGSGLYLLNLETAGLELFSKPEVSGSGNRMNDGKASPEGRFWVGGMNQAVPQQPTAGLFRIEPDGRSTRVLSGLLTSNGLAWSADGHCMFHSDSRGETLRAYDYEPETGDLSNPRLLASLGDAEGRPDGGAVDAAGFYWSAGASAGCLNRFSSDGILVERYLLPVAAPSMICFGGPALNRIFVTCLASNRRGAFEPGRLISFASPVLGLAGHRFRLTDKPA